MPYKRSERVRYRLYTPPTPIHTQTQHFADLLSSQENRIIYNVKYNTECSVSNTKFHFKITLTFKKMNMPFCSKFFQFIRGPNQTVSGFNSFCGIIRSRNLTPFVTFKFLFINSTYLKLHFVNDNIDHNRFRKLK